MHTLNLPKPTSWSLQLHHQAHDVVNGHNGYGTIKMDNKFCTTCLYCTLHLTTQTIDNKLARQFMKRRKLSSRTKALRN